MAALGPNSISIVASQKEAFSVDGLAHTNRVLWYINVSDLNYL